ncbi:hypothetical protein Tco_0960279, partial [Tanacetum coccineum]
ITKFLKEVISRAKVQSPKTKNINKSVEPKSHTQKPSRQIAIGQRFSPKKCSAMHEWIPTGKMFISSTTKVGNETLNGLNEDISNPHECEKNLDVGAGTLNLSVGTSFNPKKEGLRMESADNTSGPVPQRKERCMLQCALSSKEEKSSYSNLVIILKASIPSKRKLDLPTGIYSRAWLICMDIAKIARKRLKPDKHGHETEKSVQEPRI